MIKGHLKFIKTISVKIIYLLPILLLVLSDEGCKKNPASPLRPRDVPWKIYTTKNSKLVSNRINVILVDGADYKWFGTDEGANMFGNGSWQTYTQEVEFEGIGGTSNKVNAITIGTDDRVWFGLAGGGLRRMIRGTKIPPVAYTSPNLPSDMVYNLLTDQSGYIWVGTAKGVSCYIPHPTDPNLGTWKQYTSLTSPIPDEPIMSIAINPFDNTIWFGTYTHGLVSYNGDQDWNISAPNDNPFPITSIGFTYKNYCWVGTFADWVYQFNMNTMEWVQYGDSARGGGLPNNFVNAYAFDPSGAAWFGTNKGIAKFSNSKWKTWNKSNSQLPSDIIRSLAIDKRGNLWIGTSNGVAEFNEEGIIN